MGQKKRKFIDLNEDPSKTGYNIPKTIPCKFLNKEQEDAYNLFKTNSILIMTGPAGCGKSYLAVLMAINHLLDEENNCQNIHVLKPIVEAGENLGSLPGEYTEKVAPYLVSIFDEVDKVCKSVCLRKYISSRVKITPLAYLRGINMNQVLICDEGQNATYKQLKMLLTRISGNLRIDDQGNHIGSKIIITGDLEQTDLKNNSGLKEVTERLHDCPGIGIVNFSENAIVRHPLVAQILKRLK